MRRFLLSVLLVIACAGAAASLDHAWLSSAFADDEAAEIKPIEEKPHASGDNSSAADGSGGIIESGNLTASQSQDASKGNAVESQDAALLESDTNLVNTQQLPDSSFIYDMSIADLASADSYYDNQIVQVLGEVVGDRIFETGDMGHCWITLDVPNTNVDATIAVYMTTESAQMIDTYGKYNTRDTMLQVRGIFHLACGEHQGISDLHADYVGVVQPGVEVGSTLEFVPFLPGIIVLAMAGTLIAVYARMREKER